MKACQKCGEMIPDSAKFCRNCGTPSPVGVAASANSAPRGEEPTEILINADPVGDGGEEYQDPYQKPVVQNQNRQQRHAPYPSANAGYTPASEWDHTGEYDPNDISENKVVAMIVYLLGTLGIIIALLKSSTSPYVEFHVRQGLKFVVLNCLTVIASAILVPLFVFSMGLAAGNMWNSYIYNDAMGVGGASVFGGFFIILLILLLCFSFILMIIKIICFFSICKGKAVEPPLVRSIRFMR